MNKKKFLLYEVVLGLVIVCGLLLILNFSLDYYKGILVALIDRVRSLDNEIIRQDTMIKTILGVPQLINIDKLAKADRDDQRKD